jgi:hypothetical protein
MKMWAIKRLENMSSCAIFPKYGLALRRLAV